MIEVDIDSVSCELSLAENGSTIAMGYEKLPRNIATKAKSRV